MTSLRLAISLSRRPALFAASISASIFSPSVVLCGDWPDTTSGILAVAVSALSVAVSPPPRPATAKTPIAITHVGCKRKINEDAFLSRVDLGLWAVADGMGGHEAGEVASALLVEKLGAIRAESSLPARIVAADMALKEANFELLEMAAVSDSQRTIGSTIVALMADSQSFACLWAGDSRAYMLREGALHQLTRDHSLVQQLVDAGDIDPAAAREHPNANVITRAVGASPHLVLDEMKDVVRAGDIFLIASDGLTRLVTDDEIKAKLESVNLESAADHFRALTLDRGAPDNVTFVIVKAGR